MKKTTFIAALVGLTLSPAIHAQKIVPSSEHTHFSTETAPPEPLVVGQAAAWAAAKVLGVEIDRESKPLFELEEVTEGDERSWWISLSVGDRESSGRLIEIVGTDLDADATFEKRLPQLESIDSFSFERSVVATIIGSADRVAVGGEIVHMTLSDGSEMRMFVPLAAGATTAELERFLKRGNDFRVSGGLPTAGPASKHLPDCPGNTSPACLEECDDDSFIEGGLCGADLLICSAAAGATLAACVIGAAGVPPLEAACLALFVIQEGICVADALVCDTRASRKREQCYSACHVPGGI